MLDESEPLQEYTFVLKHHSNIDNKSVDALSHIVAILLIVNTTIIGFNHLKKEYTTFLDFEIIF